MKNKEVKMSQRLHMVADMITPELVVADIGTDHGYIPIYRIINGQSDYAYACDVNEGPLKRAKENVINYGVEEHISLCLSDGLKNINIEDGHSIESIVIAGMGGGLICRILKEGKAFVNDADELILSPHSEVCEVRKYLYSIGMHIIAENMIREDGKYYVVLKAIHNEKNTTYNISELESLFGPCLLKEKNACLIEYLNKEKDTCDKILCNLKKNGSEGSAMRVNEISRKKDEIVSALGIVAQRPYVHK